MKNLIEKFKAIFSSQEAQELQQELKDTATKLHKEAKEISSKAVEKVQETAQDVSQKAKETTDGVTKKAQDVKHAVESGLRKDGKIDFDDFLRVEVKVGTILSVEEVEKSDKLLLLQVNLGEDEPRQIVSGIKTYFADPQALVNRQAMFVTNLEPRKIFGHTSDGMIFGVNDKENFSILEPDTVIEPGTRAS